MDHDEFLLGLSEQLDKFETSLLNLNEARDILYNLINTTFLKMLEQYQNAPNNDALFKSIQNCVMASVHQKIFSKICEKFSLEDEIIYKKCCELSALKVTSDQLGALVDYAIPLPATVVELASLDMHETPSDKLTCIATAFDLTMAELKGAIVDVIALNCDNNIPALNCSDITPILATIIIHSKPIHLISNLYYIENFIWSNLTPTESECLLAFQTAIDKLKVVTKDVLLPRSTQIYCDVGLEDIFKLTNDLDNKFDNKGKRIVMPQSPLERHLENFINLMTTSTLKN